MKGLLRNVTGTGTGKLVGVNEKAWKMGDWN